MPTPTLPAPLLEELSHLLARRVGLHYPPERWRDLERGINAAARTFNVGDSERFAEWLLSAPLTPEELRALATHLTIGETYFFREEKAFAALETSILPELIEQRRASGRNLRFWSAGCSTGEEAYSIAMLVCRLLPDPSDWQITILATDINPDSLRRAEAGLYGDWSFRGTPGWIRDSWFTQEPGGKKRISPRIRKMVEFLPANLADDAPAAAANMDVIFCRNVLMYFLPERAQRAVASFHSTLVEGGWMIVSATEVPTGYFGDFVPVEFDGLTLFRKDTARRFRAPPATTFAAFPPTFTFEAATEQTDLPDLPPPPRDRPAPKPPPQAPPPPPPPPSPLARARALLANGETAEARRVIMDMIDFPSDATAPDVLFALMAHACAADHALPDALSWCERALAADKLNAAHHCLHGSILAEMGRVDDSLNALRRAVYLDPGFIFAHFTLGNLLKRAGRPQESRKSFDNARALLRKCPPDEFLPESGGITAGYLLNALASFGEGRDRR